MRGWVLAGLLGLVGSTVLIVAGLIVPGRRWRGVTFVLFGLFGVAVSAGWLALGYYVDSVVE